MAPKKVMAAVIPAAGVPHCTPPARAQKSPIRQISTKMNTALFSGLLIVPPLNSLPAWLSQPDAVQAVSETLPCRYTRQSTFALASGDGSAQLTIHPLPVDIEHPATVQVGNHISQITASTFYVTLKRVASDPVLSVVNRVGYPSWCGV